MTDYFVLKPMIDDLERRVIAGAKETDRWGAEVGTAIRALVARVEEPEKRLAACFPSGATITMGGARSKLCICSACGKAIRAQPTGNLLTSMPPQTEMACGGCGHKWGVR